MVRRKKTKSVQTVETDLGESIRGAVEGLYYTSETDAEILPFKGEKAESVSKEALLTQIGKKFDEPVEERNFEEFFTRLTEIEDWFGDEEKQTAKKFSELKKLLRAKLNDLKIFKVGTIEIDVYVVGLDEQGVLRGIKTRAVET